MRGEGVVETTGLGLVRRFDDRMFDGRVGKRDQRRGIEAKREQRGVEDRSINNWRIWSVIAVRVVAAVSSGCFNGMSSRWCKSISVTTAPIVYPALTLSETYSINCSAKLYWCIGIFLSRRICWAHG